VFNQAGDNLFQGNAMQRVIGLRVVHGVGVVL
jgi:hypothetical protein